MPPPLQPPAKPTPTYACHLRSSWNYNAPQNRKTTLPSASWGSSRKASQGRGVTPKQRPDLYWELLSSTFPSHLFIARHRPQVDGQPQPKHQPQDQALRPAHRRPTQFPTLPQPTQRLATAAAVAVPLAVKQRLLLLLQQLLDRLSSTASSPPSISFPSAPTHCHSRGFCA